jgi:PKD repeat protein
MYKWGVAVCFFVVMLVGACGCSVAAPGTGPASGTTPTLPATYIAGESTPSAENLAVTTTSTPLNAPANITGSQTNVTLTEVSITCNGQSCVNGVTTTTGTTTSTASASVTPTNTPVSTFSSNVTMAYFAQNPLLAVQFSATATNTPPYSWMWSWDPVAGVNLNSSSDPTLVLVFDQYGYYDVTRTLSNTLGTSSNSTTISVCPLEASFTTNQNAGLVPLTVQFTDTSTNQPTSWLWNFGDGSTSSLQNPVHTYTTSGVYTVRLDATNNLGSCWDTTEISVSSLTSSFTTNQTTGPIPLTIQFTDTSTDKPISWLWNFGDGTSSIQQNPTHTYTNNGTYIVNMAASNGYDKPISSPNIQILAYTPFSVDFSFTKSPVPNTTYTNVYFNDESTGFYGPIAWLWNFGDGSSSTQQNPTHQYTGYKQYNVTLFATNGQGIIGSDNVTVQLP